LAECSNELGTNHFARIKISLNWLWFKLGLEQNLERRSKWFLKNSRTSFVRTWLRAKLGTYGFLV